MGRGERAEEGKEAMRGAGSKWAGGRGRRRARKQWAGQALSVARGTIRKGVQYRGIIGAYAEHTCLLCNCNDV